MEPIFSREAMTIGWLKGDVVYDETGFPRALLRSTAVVSFDGEFLGWFENGYFRDANGDAVAYLRGAAGRPVAPAPRVIPTAPTTWALPSTPTVRVTPTAHPATEFWSEIAWAEYLRLPVAAE